MSATAGSCYGYAIRSHMPLAYLRGGDTTATLEVRPLNGDRPPADEALLLDWQPPRHPFAARLYRNRAGFALELGDGDRFYVDPGVPQVMLGGSGEPFRCEERLWGVPALLCFRARGDVALHAAAVEVDGEAFLLAAPRAFGKTTTAAAFVAHGHRLLSEDSSCVRLSDPPQVVPGPAMLRVRRDVVRRLPLERLVHIGETEERVHFALRAEDRGDCTPVPLRAVILLAGFGSFALERVELGEAIASLWALAFRLPTPEDQARSFAEIVAVAERVATWRLTRPGTPESLPDVVERIARSV